MTTILSNIVGENIFCTQFQPLKLHRMFSLTETVRARFLSFNFSFGPRFKIRGPNKRVDLIFQKPGRPDSRAKKKVPTQAARVVKLTTACSSCMCGQPE